MRTIKFQVNIIKKIVEAMFDNKIKVNILLYFTILALELIIYLNIIIIMRNINNKSSHIINYILKISIYIKNIIVY